MEGFSEHVRAAGGSVGKEQKPGADAHQDAAVDRDKQQVVRDQGHLGEKIQFHRHEDPDKTCAQYASKTRHPHRVEKDGDIEDDTAQPQRDLPGKIPGADGPCDDGQTRYSAGDKTCGVIDVFRGDCRECRSDDHQKDIQDQSADITFILHNIHASLPSLKNKKRYRLGKSADLHNGIFSDRYCTAFFTKRQMKSA